MKLAELSISIATVFLNIKTFKDDLIKYCLYCNKNYHQKIDEKLKDRFFNAYKFSNHGNNKFVLLLRKGVSSYAYVDRLGKTQ